MKANKVDLPEYIDDPEKIVRVIFYPKYVTKDEKHIRSNAYRTPAAKDEVSVLRLNFCTSSFCKQYGKKFNHLKIKELILGLLY